MSAVKQRMLERDLRQCIRLADQRKRENAIARERALKAGAKLELLEGVLAHECADGSTRANLWWRSLEKPEEAARMAVALCGGRETVSTPQEAMAFLRRQLLGGGR